MMSAVKALLSNRYKIPLPATRFQLKAQSSYVQEMIVVIYSRIGSLQDVCWSLSDLQQSTSRSWSRHKAYKLVTGVGCLRSVVCV